MRQDEIYAGGLYEGKDGSKRLVTHIGTFFGTGDLRVQYEREDNGDLPFCNIKTFARWAQKDVTGGERNICAA